MITDSVPDLFDYRWPSADCERACSLSPRGHDAIGPGLRAKRHIIILVTMETSGHGFDKRKSRDVIFQALIGLHCFGYTHITLHT
jgi:hypothetical protein